MTQEEYNSVLQRVADSLNDVDNEYKRTSSKASTLCDVNQTVNYNTNIQVVRNRGGNVVGYDYKYTTPSLPSIVGMQIDSNNDHGWYATGGGGSSRGGGAGRFQSSYYAGTVNTDQSSSDKMNGSGLVSSIISGAWAVTSTLAKFGKKVADGAADAIRSVSDNLFNNHSDLSIYEFNGNIYDGTFVARALFATNVNTGDIDMFLDGDVFGAIAMQLRDDGFFADSPVQNHQDDSVTDGNLVQPIQTVTSYHFEGSNRYGRYHVQVNCPYPVAFYSQSRGITVRPDANNATYTYTERNLSTGVTETHQSTIGTSVATYTRNGKTVIYTGPPYSGIPFNPNNYSNVQTYFPINRLKPNTSAPNGADAWIIKYGSASSPSSTPGITPWPGTTDMVDAVTGADPHVVSENLYSQYPDVMGAPILINVMDDSCNPVTKKYYKVPITYSPTNNTVEVPVSLNGEFNPQINPSFNPDFNFDPSINVPNTIQNIIDLISGSGGGYGIATEVPDPEGTPPEPGPGPEPGNPTPVQTLDPEIPDTGSGTAPDPETELPVVDVRSMWHVYNPATSQLEALGNWLWSTNILDVLIRTFSNPLESIMGVHAIYGEPHVSGAQNIVVGPLTSDVSALVVTSQYTTVDCGSVWLTEYFGNVFDYYPYTKVSLFLPFVGIVDLSTADVMRGKISVSYNIDVYSGAAVAFVSIERDGVGGVIYQYPANCAIEYPVSSASYSRLMQATITTAVTAVAALTGEVHAAGAAGAASNALAPNKIQVQRSGNFSGNIGAMGSKRPYLIITRPQTNMAINFEKYDGLASNFTTQLGSCKGYTKCKEVHLNCPGAYKEELDEIESLLLSGVILPDSI